MSLVHHIYPVFSTFLTQAWMQSHYREVPRWEIFMEQELRFGPVGITEKKIWAVYEQLLRPFFSIFRGQKKEEKLKTL